MSGISFDADALRALRYFITSEHADYVYDCEEEALQAARRLGSEDPTVRMCAQCWIPIHRNEFPGRRA